MTTVQRLPTWLRKSLEPGRGAESTDELIRDLGLNTICESGHCPNRNECWSQKTATFMIMGNRCTRNCGYCAVRAGKPAPLEADEPVRVADAVGRLGLLHVVVTSVTRDDLADEGAAHFAAVVRALKDRFPDLIVEVLTPDFRKAPALAAAAFRELEIDIFGHNIETVRRLHRRARPQGGYEISLELLGRVREARPDFITKSGAMLGLGETRDEVIELMDDLRQAGCRMLTLGQYLRSFEGGLPVERFVAPEEFEEYRRIALNKGFLMVESGSFVRSSYHAKGSFEKLKELLGRDPQPMFRGG